MTADLPRPGDYCDETCTVDCGHCKGAGPTQRQRTPVYIAPVGTEPGIFCGPRDWRELGWLAEPEGPTAPAGVETVTEPDGTGRMVMRPSSAPGGWYRTPNHGATPPMPPRQGYGAWEATIRFDETAAFRDLLDGRPSVPASRWRRWLRAVGVFLRVRSW